MTEKKEVLKKRIINDELRRQLAGLYPCTNEFSVTFTPECYKDIPEEFKPKFTLKPYSHKELKEVVVKTEELKGDDLDNYANDMIRKKIVNISNLVDISTGEVIKFQTNDDGYMSRDLYDSIPLLVKSQLMQELNAISSGIR